MNPMRIKSKFTFLIYYLFFLSIHPATFAQNYPDKPIKIVVGFAPGGLADTIIRALQPKLADGFGQAVLIENKGGAGGTIAEAQIAKSPPDGYNMMIGVDSVPVNPYIYKNLSYDIFKDIQPVSLSKSTSSIGCQHQRASN
jgi:tripartite-type tricarboxylate transporter receptor subunit TctC